MLEEIKNYIIKNYQLNEAIHTKHNNVYEGERIVLIESVVSGELKIKARRR